jgi:hypothetical protein
MKILSISDMVVPELSERFDARPFDGVELILELRRFTAGISCIDSRKARCAALLRAGQPRHPLPKFAPCGLRGHSPAADQIQGASNYGVRGITLVQRRADSVPGLPDAANDLAHDTGAVVQGRRGYGGHPCAAPAYPRCGRPLPPGLRQLFNANQPIQTPLFYPWPHSRPLHRSVPAGDPGGPYACHQYLCLPSSGGGS